MSGEVIPAQENQTPYFSDPIKAGIVCLRKQRPDGQGGGGREWPAPWRSPGAVAARAPPPGTAAGRRRACVLKCKLKLDQ